MEIDDSFFLGFLALADFINTGWVDNLDILDIICVVVVGDMWSLWSRDLLSFLISDLFLWSLSPCRYNQINECLELH